MFCSFCGTYSLSEARFCHKCGCKLNLDESQDGPSSSANSASTITCASGGYERYGISHKSIITYQQFRARMEEDRSSYFRKQVQKNVRLIRFKEANNFGGYYYCKTGHQLIPANLLLADWSYQSK